MCIIVDKIMYICISGKQDSQITKTSLFSVLLPLLWGHCRSWFHTWSESATCFGSTDYGIWSNSKTDLQSATST